MEMETIKTGAWSMKKDRKHQRKVEGLRAAAKPLKLLGFKPAPFLTTPPHPCVVVVRNGAGLRECGDGLGGGDKAEEQGDGWWEWVQRAER